MDKLLHEDVFVVELLMDCKLGCVEIQKQTTISQVEAVLRF